MSVGFKSSFSRREIASKAGVTEQNIVDLLGNRTEYTNAEALVVCNVKDIADRQKISFSKAIQEYKAQEPETPFSPQSQAHTTSGSPEFAQPFEAQSIAGLGLEFDQHMTQLMQAAGAQQQDNALAMREFETVMRLLNEAALDKATENRYMAIAQGIIEPSPNEPLEQWFLQAYQAIVGKKQPAYHNSVEWQNGRMVLRLQPQRSTVCPLQIAAAAAQNGGALPSLIKTLPQLPAPTVNPSRQIPVNLQFLLPASES